MKKSKKLLSLLLAALMVLSLLPTFAFAANDNVAKIGETEYATLQEAVNAAVAQDVTSAENAPVIELLRDCEVYNTHATQSIYGAMTIAAGFDRQDYVYLTIDGNGHKVIPVANPAGSFEEGSGSHTYYASTHGTIKIQGNANVTLKDLTIIRNADVMVQNYGLDLVGSTVTLDNVFVEGTDSYGINASTTPTYKTPTVIMKNSGTVEKTGLSGNTKVQGAVYTIYESGGVYGKPDATGAIRTFSKGDVVKGGRFVYDPLNYLAEGLSEYIDAEGYYVVGTLENPAATITRESKLIKSESADKAIEYAQSGDTVILYAAASQNKSLDLVGKTFTIVLGANGSYTGTVSTTATGSHVAKDTSVENTTVYTVVQDETIVAKFVTGSDWLDPQFSDAAEAFAYAGGWSNKYPLHLLASTGVNADLSAYTEPKIVLEDGVTYSGTVTIGKDTTLTIDASATGSSFTGSVNTNAGAGYEVKSSASGGVTTYTAENTVEDNFVAQVGDKKYETIGEAIAVLNKSENEGSSLIVLKDQSFTSGSSSSLITALTKDSIIDLAGKQIKVEGGTGGSNCAYDYVFKLNLSTSSSTKHEISIKDSSGSGELLNSNSNSGTSGSSCVFLFSQPDTLNIEGGTYSARNIFVNQGKACTINISGGTFIGYNVDGGSFGINTKTTGSTTINIAGGTFATKPSEFGIIATGYEEKQNPNGTWTVSEKQGYFKAKIGDKKYTSLADAVAEATDGKTVRMIANETVKYDDSAFYATVSGNKTITLDLNGYTVNGTSTKTGYTGLIFVDNGSKLTVKDSSQDKTGALKYTDQADDQGGATIRVWGCLDVEGGLIENLTKCEKSAIQAAVDVYANEWGKEYSPKELVFNLKGGTIKSNGDNTIRLTNFSAKNLNNPTSVTVNVTGGKVTGGADAFFIHGASNDDFGINTLNIYDGEFDCTQPVRIFGNYSAAYTGDTKPVTVNISGGYFKKGDSSKTFWKGVAVQNNGSGVVEAIESVAEVSISGGLFNYDTSLADGVISGYAVVANTDTETQGAYPWKVAKTVTVSGVSMSYPAGKSSYTYGDTADYTGTPVATKDSQSVNIGSWTYTYYQNNGTEQSPTWNALDTTPTNAGNYKLVVAAVDPEYTGEMEIKFTIAPKPITVKADSKSGVVGGTVPTLTYTVDGLVGSEKLTTEPTLSCTPDVASDKLTTAKAYAITVSGGSVSDNYTLSYQDGTLTVLKASQLAPAKGVGYTVSGITLKAADKYEILISGEETPTSDNITIASDKSYFVRLKADDNHYASPYTPIDTTVTINVLTYPANMGTVAITGVTDGKCNIGAQVTATATPATSTTTETYEFVEWRDAAGNKITDAAAATATYKFTATASQTLTAVFKMEGKIVVEIPTAKATADRIYTGETITGVTATTGCTVSGNTGTNANTYTATATLENNDTSVWADGTTAPKTITWVIYKDSQTAPAVVGGDTSITGVDNAMEYMAKGGNSYTKITDNNISNGAITLDPGTYYVRFAADANHLASPAVVVTVSLPTITVTTIQPEVKNKNSAKLYGSVTPYSDERITEAGFEYKLASVNDWNSAQKETVTKDAVFNREITGLAAGTKYIVRAYAVADNTTIYGAQTTFYTLAAEPTGAIDVFIEKDGDREVTLTIEKGNAAIASVTFVDNTWKFNALADGFYNIVVRTTDGDFTETRLVEVTDGKVVASSFSIPAGKIATVVDVKTEDTPAVAVDGLAEILTETEKNDAAAGSVDVEIKLEVEAKAVDTQETETKAAVNAIKEVISSGVAIATEETITEVLDLSLIKTISELDEKGEVASVNVQNIGSANNKVLEIAVPYEGATVGAAINVYRVHDGAAEKLVQLSNRPSGSFVDGTYFIGNGYIFIYASDFSTYVMSTVEEITEFTVTFNANDGYCYTLFAKTNASRKLAFLPIAFRSGYTFDGWYTEKTGGTKITMDTVFTADETVYAHWTKNYNPSPITPVTPPTPVDEGCPKDSTCPMAQFSDLDMAKWYHDGVHYCLEEGLMNGVGGGKFNPNGTTTRAMIVTMLWRLEGEPVANYAMSFKDVPAGKWYTEAVRWAQANKIVEGYSADKFGPDDIITREQLATILYRYAKLKGEGFTGSWYFPLDFVDTAKISTWADEAIHWCSMKGIVNGKDGKVFDPQGKATRAEAAAMIQRFCER